MSCVNRSSKEFKFLAEHNDLSINALELITHKYWIENKTEDYFPSDVYIQAQLGKIPYEEPFRTVRELWDLKYKEPQEYASLETLEDARREALRYFPEEAITYHRNFKDNYVLVVRKPLAKLSLSISDLTGKTTHDEQELADYNLITGNLIKELGKNSTFAKAIITQQQDNSNIKDFINGKKKFNNLSEKENDIARRDRILAAAGIQARRNESPSSEESQDERNERQERQVEAWAKQNGVWHQDAISYGKSFGAELPGGQESHVYENANKGTVVKVKNTLQYHDLQEFLDGIILHNTLFPETAYKVLGFGNDGEGFVAILEQPFVRGEEPTQEQITDYIKSIQPDAEMYEKELKNGRYKTSKTLIHDVSPRNAIITPAGNIAVIDGIIRPNVASEGKGGERTEDSSIVSTEAEFNDIQMSTSSPQTFTFKDGTTVKAPFKPNYQQEDALNAMDEFIKSNRTSMTLSGFAGTGKTSLMEMLAEKMRKQYRPVMFCASTNKAAAVLKERVSKSGFEAQTLNKVFGITVEVDPNKSYNARNLVNRLKDVDIPYGTTVIIDEASMINEENYAILNDIAKRNGLKIIYVGDAAQLAPVNETKISKVFRDQSHEVRTLSIVERTGDNAILKEATDLRDGKALSGESSFNSKGQGVAYIKSTNTKDREAVIRRFIPELKNNPNYFRILAFTNAAVAAYNTKVRQLLGYNDNIPRVGEPITGYANWGYTWDRNGGSYKFINSEAYKVVAVQQPKTITKDLPKVGKVSLQIIPITLENSLGEKRDYNLIDIKGNQENRAVAFRLAKAKAELHNTANKLGGRAQIPYRQAANAIEEFLFVNDTLGEKINGKEVAYQTKVFDFGYAMTVHKSQGSTFTHVLMDDVDISKARDERNTGMGLEDIPLTWDDTATNEPVTYEVSGPMEDIDMGTWEDETSSAEGTLIQEAPKAENPNAANIRQQLKYVAVSRATDTVTIISDNVKKEDTPLNHINEAPASQEATQQKPVEQMSSAEVWRYLAAMQPLTKRSQITYTPKGQEKQTYTVENGHIYNKEGKEVYPENTVHKTHRNKILANYAVQEGLAVVVKHPTSGEDYVVDNNGQIISVRTGDIMKWGEENGDRRKILAQAEKEFRERITATKERGNTLNEQMLDQLKLIGLDLHYEDEMAQYLKEHGNKAIQQAIAEQQEMQDIKAKAQANGTFMKAPNGKDTNLTERQWLQVRTKNFINWFGDWINDPANASKVVDKNGEPLVVYHGTSRKLNNNSFKSEFIFASDNDIIGAGYAFQRKGFSIGIDYALSNFAGEDINSFRNHIDNHIKELENEIEFGKDMPFYQEGDLDAKKNLLKELKKAKQEVKSRDIFKEFEFNVFNLFQNIKNPLTVDAKGKYWHSIEFEGTTKKTDEITKIAKDRGYDGLIITNVIDKGAEASKNGEYAEVANDYIAFEPNQIKSATDNNGMFSTENNDIQAIQTAEGEVRGFATPEGSLYFDRTVMSPEHGIHEYTHLWDRVVAKNNPELWHRGVALMKKISLWKEIENDENYGKKWKALKGMTPEKLESLIASEVHSRLTGVNGEQILDRLSKEKGQKGIIGRLKQWLLDFWKDLKGTFSNWSQEDLDELTLQDFTMMTIRDLADGFNPNTFRQAPVEQTESKQKTIPASYEGMITPDANTIFVFGSNPEGRHGAGAAKTAKEKFGAIYGQGEGLQGNSYALPTKDLRSKPLYSEDGGKTPIVMYRGYALTENREAYNIEETVGKTAVDYDASLKGSLYFTSSEEEAQDYAKGRTDKSPEPPTQENPQGRPVNRHYTGDYAKVSKYFIAPNAKVEHYKDIKDYIKNGRNSNADVIVLDEGTAFSENTEYIVKNPNVIVYDKMLRSISPTQITENIRKMYEVARQNPSKQFKVAYTNGLNEATLNGYTGAEMIKMFKDAGPIPSNVVFSKVWTDHWNEVQSEQQPAQFEYARNANGRPNYEVSSRGDKRFSAMTATFAPGTTLFGHDVGGRTIESVYQNGVKQGQWHVSVGNQKTGAPTSKEIIKGNTEDDSYYQGYLPLWQEWARQNPQLIEELRQKAQGKVLTDMFASTAVSQARALADVLNSTINQQNQRSYNSTINITQNASGRLGSLDKADEGAYKAAKATLRNPQATAQQIEEATNTLQEIFDRKNAEMQTILAEAAKVSGATFSIEDAAGSWLGGEEYSFRVKVEAKTREDYDKAIQALSYVAEAARQDAFIENLGEVNKNEVTSNSLLSGEHTPFIHISFDKLLSQQEIAVIQDLFSQESTEDLPLDATITEGEMVFALPVWKLGENATYEDYLRLYNNWNNKIFSIYDRARNQENSQTDGRRKAGLERMVGAGYRQAYERSRFHEAGNAYSEKPERDYTSFRDSYLSERGLSKESKGTLSEKEGQQVKQAVEQILLPQQESLDTSAIFQNPSSTEVTVEDKMKPWRSDPSKQNISRRIYLKGHKDKGYFEVVKDFEDGYYSVHFKPTDSDNPNAFSKDEKEVLFRAVADTIPVDGKLSTWGELSRGGIAGLERFSKLGFAQSGERTVRMKGTGEEVTIPVFTKYPDTTARISLKGYEYFTGASEDTLVDAPWKIPFLQELDRQFSTENPEGRNEEILQQMKDILDAKSFEEWQNNTDSETKEKVQKNLDEYDQLITQLNNLLDSNIITASEVRHVAELVVNAISDNITQLQKEKGLAEQQFPTLNSKLDFQTASRKDIITAIGINKLVYRAKLLFDPEANEYEDLDTIEQADLIIDNWDAIMTLASDIFAANEGVGISRDFDNGGWRSVEGQKIDFDNFNDYENDPDAMAEEIKDEQEHWQIEQRTIDILNSMSAMVRLALHECYQVDKEGNVIKSKWGIPERVNARNAVNSILRWTQGSLSLEDMIAKLSAKQGQHPWLGQLIERLNDKTGNETDFQSQFYGVFAKHFQLYSVVLLEDGKYHSMTVNSHPALTEAMQTVTTQFKVGEHPLFTQNGINMKLLGTENTVGKNAEFNLHKALSELRDLSNRINKGEDVDADMAETATNNIMGVCRVLGYPVAESMVSEIVNSDNILYLTEKLGFIVDNLDKAAKAGKKDYDPFAYKKENSIGGSLRNFLTPITDQLEDTATNAFYDSGKMYQSYVTPSFMTKLLQKFRLEGQDFEDFLDSEYGNSEWFKFKGRNGAWRNEWLRMLATNEEARKIFDHKVELNFNKHNYMRNMTDAEYTLSLFAEYFAEGINDKQAMVPAWFRIPIQSNKPSSEFIKFYSYRGADYKNDIRDGLYNMFLQELSRIQTVRMRNLPKNHPSFIKNFDKNGKMFNFLPFFNSYLEDTAAAKRGRNLLDTTDSVDENADFARILQKKLRGDELTSDEEANLMKYAKKAIYNHMDRRAQEILNRWEQEGILEAAKQVEGVGKEDADVRNSIENYLWNDAFAAKNILQLTVGDIAFYKDAEDLQKRLAQLHAPGIRGNVAATDYQGNRVSDGYYRTFILQDFDAFRSNIIANITEVFDRKIARAPKSQKAQLEALKDSLVRPPKTNGPDDKGGKYWNINVTDAQGYSSPSSYRKKAFIFGKWSHKAEDIYQKLLSGEYNYTDLEVAFQPLKPFVYTHLEKHIGDGTPIETMNVPFQAKNSEYLLIMADAIMQSEVKESGELSRPNLLRAIYRVMEDSERLNPTKGIDTVQFESAIKSGLQGKINIHQFAEDAGGESLAYNEMMSQIYQNYDRNKSLEEQQLQYNTDTFVHEASFEDYCLQQEVPEHFKDHSQAHGSQIRMITPSDLDLYKDPNGNPNDENNINYYEWTEPDGTKRKVRADEFKKEYEQTIADNIAESIENLSKELHLDSSDKKERNIALSKILLREILSSPRYGVDLAQACAVDKATGEFRIPKGDPIQAKRIEQLINSIIKNRVNKQKIAGGPIVQVTNFGTSKQLHIRFNTKSGGLLKMEDEFTPDEKYKTYDEYKKAEQAGIAYFEVFIPIWANEIFEKFANEDGTIDVKAIEAVDPDLLKMISYRIPTEDKYSCAPMKVVGFMPREAGDAIMLPWELTEIDDSDFDVDKRYVMRKDIKIKENKPAIEKLLIKRVSESYAKAHNGKVNRKFIIDQVKMYMDNPDRMKTADALMASIHREKQLIMKQHKDKVYKTVKPTSGRTYRDNKIVDMTWAVLTNEMTADKILNPCSFDNFKRVGYMAAAYRLKSHEMSWSQLQEKTTDELNDLCYVDKDLTWADIQIQFYKQNAAAASLIGVFAVNKVAHATLEGDDIFLAVDEVCGEEPFYIAGMQFSGRMQVDPKYDREGNLIGKTLGSGVSASADAAKTPVLNLLNINMTTVGTFTSLLRLGMPHEDACMFIGQDVIARVLDDFNRQNLTGYASLNSVITKEINRLREKHGITEDSAIDKEPLTKEELIEGLTPDEHEVIDYKVLIAFQKAKAIADSIKKLSFPTRFNSISSAVGPLIIDNLILEHKMEQFMDENADTHFYTAGGQNVDITDVFADHPILNQFSRTVDIARQMTSDMPAGSTGFRNMLAQLPEDVKEKIYNDKKMFSKLSDFYQSYLAIASGLVNPANLKNYINGFPKWFMKQDFKEKYPDNALIQAIQMTVSKKTGRAFLSIKLTGEDETVKETYRNAWIDLHKTNPELSQQLFEYCFFRAGIGFSPKTFMAVVPTYVKERLQRKMPNGETATYLDTYRRFPSIPNEVMIDQFIANNWEDNKLVPKKGGKNSHFTIKGSELYATTQEDIQDLEGASYIKVYHKGETRLYKLVLSSEDGMHYTELKPLGNNGEYLEMDLVRITTPMSKTTQTSENNDASEIKTTSTSETDAAEEKQEPLTTENKRAKAIAALARDYMNYNEVAYDRRIKESKANAQAEDMVNHPERYGSLMQSILKAKGINMSKDDAIKKLKDLDLC